MEHNNVHKQSSVDILEKIKKGSIKMRPKWHFALNAGLLITGTLIVCMTLVYLGSFIYYSLHRTGVMFAPEFGLQGWYVFLISLPWLLIALSLCFIVILELLVRHYAFAYRLPLLYSLLSIVVVIFVGGVIVNQTPLHQRLMRSADDENLPFAGRMYRAYGRPRLPQVHAGIVTGLNDDGCDMEDLRGDTLSVFITPQTRMPVGMPLLIGDHIVVIGQRFNDTIRAFGIRKVLDWNE